MLSVGFGYAFDNPFTAKRIAQEEAIRAQEEAIKAQEEILKAQKKIIETQKEAIKTQEELIKLQQPISETSAMQESDALNKSITSYQDTAQKAPDHAVNDINKMIQTKTIPNPNKPATTPSSAPSPEFDDKMEYYNNTGINAKVDGVTYTVNGTKVFGNGNFLFDLRNYSCDYKDLGVSLDREFAKTLLITDMTYDTWKGETILYIAAIGFKVDQGDIANAEHYNNNNGLRIGRPYTFVFSYLVNQDKVGEIYPYSADRCPVYTEIIEPLSLTYSAPFTSKGFNDLAHDSVEEFDMIFNYAATVAHPRIIKSKYKEHTLYYLREMNNNENMEPRSVGLCQVNTSREQEGFYKTHPGLCDISFDSFNAAKQQLNIDYEVNLSNFYVHENGVNDFFIGNAGDKHTVGFSFNLLNKAPNGRLKLKALYK